MRSILLHIYDDTGLESRMQASFDLARAFEAHLTCLHATPFEDYLETDPLVAARLPEAFSEKMRSLRLALKARVEERLAIEGLSWDWLHLDSLPSEALARFSIVSDLVVVSLAGRALMRDEPRPLAATVAISSRAPVLAVPEGVTRVDLDAPVLIAWNGSPEAAAAMRAAVPILRRAPAVALLEVEEKKVAYPRDLAARYLSRHDVHAEIVQAVHARGSVSEMIEHEARRRGAGLIVMGAYGRSRLREFLFGGVTHDLVSTCSLPLLLAH